MPIYRPSSLQKPQGKEVFSGATWYLFFPTFISFKGQDEICSPMYGKLTKIIIFSAKDGASYPPTPLFSEVPIAGKCAEWGTHRSCPVAGTREAEISFPACRDSLRAVYDGKAGAVMYSRRPEGLLSNKDGSKAETPLRAFHNAASYQKLVISP